MPQRPPSTGAPTMGFAFPGLLYEHGTSPPYHLQHYPFPFNSLWRLAAEGARVIFLNKIGPSGEPTVAILTASGGRKSPDLQYQTHRSGLLADFTKRGFSQQSTPSVSRRETRGLTSPARQFIATLGYLLTSRAFSCRWMPAFHVAAPPQPITVAPTPQYNWGYPCCRESP